MLLFWTSIHQRIMNKNVSQFPQNIKLFWTLIIIRNVKHIRMISEGSCDTEDWGNDAENSALITGINYILTCIQIENNYFKL